MDWKPSQLWTDATACQSYDQAEADPGGSRWSTFQESPHKTGKRVRKTV